MIGQVIDEKQRWINEVKTHSKLLIEFITTGLTEKNSRTQNWKGFSILGEINSFIQEKASKVTGIVRLWKKQPIFILRFPGEINYPIKMKLRFNIIVPFSHPSLKHEEYQGWSPTKTTPDWLKRFLPQFQQRITQAKINYEQYIDTRDHAYQVALQDPESLKKYQEFLKHYQNALKYLKNKYNDYYSSYPCPYEPPIMPNKISQIHLGYDPDFTDYLDSEGKNNQNFVKTIDDKIDTLVQNGEIIKKDHSYIFPSDFSELGAAKARALGFLSKEVTKLEQTVEWSALQSEPYFWFEPKNSRIHDITSINWNEILDLTEFEEKITIEDVLAHIPWKIPHSYVNDYINDEYDSESIKNEYTSRIPMNFNAILDEIYGIEYALEETLSIPFQDNKVSGKTPLREWLEPRIQSFKTNQQKNLMYLDPQFLSEIPNFPSSCVQMVEEKGDHFLELCWRSVEEKNKSQMIRFLKQKYATLLQEPLNFLFEEAPSHFQNLQHQVGILVENVTQIEQRLKEATKVLLELAGGWTPSWLDKEIHVLRQVLENALGKELPREKLIQQWKLWLKDRNMYRSTRELRYNLRGLERANALEESGIFTKQGSTDGKGAKPSIFYLKSNRGE